MTGSPSARWDLACSLFCILLTAPSLVTALSSVMIALSTSDALAPQELNLSLSSWPSSPSIQMLSGESALLLHQSLPLAPLALPSSLVAESGAPSAAIGTALIMKSNHEALFCWMHIAITLFGVPVHFTDTSICMAAASKKLNNGRTQEPCLWWPDGAVGMSS